MTAARSYRDLVERRDEDDTPRHPGRRMTETEFVNWCTADTWAEWVNGEVILMSPVNIEHAELFSFLHALMKTHADENKLGRVLCEPFQVRLGSLRRRRSPDIFFVSTTRSSILQRSHAEGGPDLILEIVSFDSQSRDRREKYLEYMAAGVREYWIVDPLTQTVEAHVLSRGRYRPIEEINGTIHSIVLKDFFLKPQWLSRKNLPSVPSVLRELAKSKRTRNRRA